MIKGIDISEHQRIVDFAKVKKAGIKWVIIREGYRKRIDAYLCENVKEAQKAGLPVLGVYHFIYTDGASITENAESTVANIRKAGLDPTSIWIFADLEEDTWTKNGMAVTRARCSDFLYMYLTKLRSLGCKNTGIYTNNDYYMHYIDWTLLSDWKDKVWLADYSGGSDQPCIIQQTGEDGKVDGINGTVDTDELLDESIYYSLYPDLSDGTEVHKVSKTRAAYVAKAQSWIGKNEYDGSHRMIIDTYNSYEPHPRGYAVQYTDAWCATFVSAVAITLGYTDIIPIECGCPNMIDLAKSMGIWVESDDYTPMPGDIVMYDWQDSGSGDNTGVADHVGIVEGVNGDIITVIEGNYSDSVKRRSIAINGRYIRGYIVPGFDGAETVTPLQTSHKTVKRGSKGSTVKTLQEKLVALGYTLECDGDFGPATEKAVKGFQKLYGLEQDGVAGSATWRKLDELTEISKEPKWTGSITLPPLPVRVTPSESAELLPDWPYLGHGNLVDVCGEIGDWCYVRIAGKYFGYIPAENVKAACGDACEIMG